MRTVILKRKRKPNYLNYVVLFTATLYLTTLFTTIPVRSQPSSLFPQKGICYVTWDRDKFASQYSDESLSKIAKLGAEYVSICSTHYQEKYNSTKIISTEKTPSESSISHVIRKSHELGLKVMLKPHIDLIDDEGGTYWRADIGFANENDWKKWFEDYKNLLIKYAKLSEKLNVEMLCVGTELSFASQKQAYWTDLISEIRKIFKGKLIYAANWDDYKEVSFWNILDYIGIDAYFPLTYKENPSLEDIKNGWNKWKTEIESWQKKIGKAVIFTEIGYPSAPHAASTPWKNGLMGNPDISLQTKCYQAFFQAMWNQPWLAGVYWWQWETNARAGGENNRYFTPQNKPAEGIIETNYKAENATE